MIKRVLAYLFVVTSWNVYGQVFDESKPIWDQYKLLFCTTYMDLSCDLEKCEPKNVNRSFELDFFKNELRYLGKINLKNELIGYSFYPKDSSIRTKVTNSISLKGSALQIFNFQKKNFSGKPEFIVTESQIGLLPTSKSDIKTITYFSECYPK
jgi:hypothetical protein